MLNIKWNDINLWYEILINYVKHKYRSDISCNYQNKSKTDFKRFYFNIVDNNVLFYHNIFSMFKLKSCYELK